MSRRKTNVGPCSTPGCDGDAKVAGKCAACYQYTWWWQRQTPARLFGHQRKLTVRQIRLDALAPRRVPLAFKPKGKKR